LFSIRRSTASHFAIPVHNRNGGLQLASARSRGVWALKYRLSGTDPMDVGRETNGGFPEPLAGEPIRLVRCRHDACGASTRVRLPRALPARAVRRVVCEGCRQPFDAGSVDDEGVLAGGKGAPPAASRRLVPDWLSNPESRTWKYLSIPLAAAAVIAALLLLQGSDGSERQSAPRPAVDAGGGGGAATAAGGGGAAAEGSGNAAELVKGSSYTLALPAGWARTEIQNGATFAASAEDGGADATLWVQNDPKLDFPQFESQSLAQLRQVAGTTAHVDSRTTAPTADGTIVTLTADSPAGAPAYEVTLRLAGPYRYYLATTVEPDASPEAVNGAELIHNSFVPVATGKAG
jgi:hypothetical protein